MLTLVICTPDNNIKQSPLVSEEQPPLKEGDVVKVDIGVHIDGHIAVAAHTIVCGVQPTPEVRTFATLHVKI